MPHLWHLTLNTGEGRHSSRSEVAEDLLTTLSPLVEGGGGTVHGLTVAIISRRDGWASFTLGCSEVPDMFFMLCWDERTHTEAWREALEHFGLSPTPAMPGFVEPPVPWLTAEFLVGAVTRTPEQLAMLGDAERCVAWAILEGS